MKQLSGRARVCSPSPVGHHPRTHPQESPLPTRCFPVDWHTILLLCKCASCFSGADYGQISEETWTYLNSLYGGGPEIAIRQSVAQLPDPENLHGEQKIEAETRAV